MTVAYEGTRFHGWQKQHPPGQDPLRTVQGVLEEAVQMVVREEVNVVGASRTDSGVHARGQVAAFTARKEFTTTRLAAGINSRLPADVQVQALEIVDESFAPISDCVAKGYRYRLAYGRKQEKLPPLFDRHITAWTAYELDVERMAAAAQHFVGEHDFASVTRVKHDRESTVRTVFSCNVTEPEPRRCEIDISGNGFLYNMVRIVAGTLVEVGRGKIEPGDVAEILKARDRQRAGPTMVPEGLCLMWVKY